MKEEETKPILLSPIEVSELEAIALALESIAKAIRNTLECKLHCFKSTKPPVLRMACFLSAKTSHY